MAKKSKAEMIEEMRACKWHFSCSESDPWDVVKAEYDTFCDEDGSSMFPNGRDYDAEDEDGP